MMLQQTIASTLTRKVRGLTDQQIARHWFPDTKHPVANARRLIRKQAGDGILEIVTLSAHPETVLSHPLVKHVPGKIGGKKIGVG